MLFRTNLFERREGSLNLTPVIDIVFLLIIFFMLLCQFIVAENFPVNVPDNCSFAKPRRSADSDVTTITVMKSPGSDGIDYAVGSKKITGGTRSAVAGGITRAVDERLKARPSGRRVVCLRVDKDIRFCDTQYALFAIAESSAADIRLAALPDRESVKNDN